MKIDNTGPVRPGAARRTGQTSRGTGFAGHLDTLRPTEAAAPARAAGPVDSIVFLQEVEDGEVDDRAARRRGEDLLRHLDLIRDGLLTGQIPRHGLVQLENAVRRARARAADPRLADILDEIELRARVELAKYVRAA